MIIKITKLLTKTEFLNLIKVLRMLYGRDFATKVFENNFKTFYNVDSASLSVNKGNN